jgi:hypothetical protein
VTAPAHALTLKDFILAARSLSRADFLKANPDPLLVAMGVLDTEEIRAKCGSTTELCVSKPATHNPQAKHPLVGRVFIVPLSSWPSGSIVFGREPPSDVVLADDTVSIRHCAVRWDGTDVTVADLGSTNGTLVNLRPVRPSRPVELLNEDIITVGRHSFQFFLPQQLHTMLQVLATPPNMPRRG